MLIAMMSKSFDMIWEKQALNFQFLTAKVILRFRNASLAPPPFNLLSVPFYMGRGFLDLMIDLTKMRRRPYIRLGDSSSDVPGPGKLVKVQVDAQWTWQEFYSDAAARGGRLPTVGELRAVHVHSNKDTWVPVTATDWQSGTGLDDGRASTISEQRVQGENCWANIGPRRYAVEFPDWGLQRGDSFHEDDDSCRPTYFFVVIIKECTQFEARLQHEAMRDPAALGSLFEGYRSSIGQLMREIDEFIVLHQADAAAQEESYKKRMLKDATALSLALEKVDAKVDSTQKEMKAMQEQMVGLLKCLVAPASQALPTPKSLAPMEA